MPPLEIAFAWSRMNSSLPARRSCSSCLPLPVEQAEVRGCTDALGSGPHVPLVQKPPAASSVCSGEAMTVLPLMADSHGTGCHPPPPNCLSPCPLRPPQTPQEKTKHAALDGLKGL
jgi:hypothetical protein